MKIFPSSISQLLSTQNIFLSRVAISGCVLLCLTGFVDPPIALLMGIGISQVLGNPFIQFTRIAAQRLLQVSVIGLGFGMNLFEAIQVSQGGFVLTLCSIAITLILGFVIGKALSTNRKTSWLISFGTAICGGSAIAAIAPIIDAEESETSMALGIVFLLNSIALFLFPYIGSILHLNSAQFGMWSAIAIHDTSSVVGAAQKFGADALQIATTVKLARALWIIPLAVIAALVYSRKGYRFNFPFFIFLFVAASMAHTFLPQLNEISVGIVALAKKGLILALFFIGTGLAKFTWKLANPKPLMLGIILWLIISVGSLFAILW